MTDPTDFAALMPFAASIGVQIDRGDKDEVVGRLPYDESRTTAGGTVHGGALMALADTVGAICAVFNLPPDAGTATTSSSTVFLRGTRGEVTATARPLHAGRSTIVVRTELRDADGRLLAQVTQSQAVLNAASGR